MRTGCEVNEEDEDAAGTDDDGDGNSDDATCVIDVALFVSFILSGVLSVMVLFPAVL